MYKDLNSKVWTRITYKDLNSMDLLGLELNLKIKSTEISQYSIDYTFIWLYENLSRINVLQLVLLLASFQ